jgi:hypothetical protein
MMKKKERKTGQKDENMPINPFLLLNCMQCFASLTISITASCALNLHWVTDGLVEDRTKDGLFFLSPSQIQIF